MSKNNRRQNNRQRENVSDKEKKVNARNISKLLVMIAATMIIFGVYRFMITQYYFEIVLGIYIAAATVSVLGYVIYNRGFSRRGVTEDMLPDSWSDEEKKEFIEDGERRLVKSRPLLILIFAFAFTFVADIMELYALPLIKDIFTK
jgi:hypothetical protein